MECQFTNGKTSILPEEQLGKWFKDFYAQWDYNAPRLKKLSCLMYDAYIAETEDANEVTDASLFTMGFVDMLRAYSTEMTLEESGKLFLKNIIHPLQEGNPLIVERMFYAAVSHVTNLSERSKIVKFYRSLEDLLNKAIALEGQPII